MCFLQYRNRVVAKSWFLKVFGNAKPVKQLKIHQFYGIGPIFNHQNPPIHHHAPIWCPFLSVAWRTISGDCRRCLEAAVNHSVRAGLWKGRAYCQSNPSGSQLPTSLVVPPDTEGKSFWMTLAPLAEGRYACRSLPLPKTKESHWQDQWVASYIISPIFF